ncbi:MAG: BatD family protein [Fuerstiella sp.]
MSRPKMRGWLPQRCLFYVLMFAATSAHVVAQEPGISAKLGSERIFIGEAVGYTVVVSNVEDPPEPDLSNFADFDVQFLGQRSQNSQFSSIINGVRTDTRRFGKTYEYSLTPSKTGQLTIPAPTVVVDGKTLSGKSLELSVEGASVQDSVFLNAVVEPAGQLYPTQKFTVVLQIDVRRLGGALIARSPLSIQETVQLKIPWLTEAGLPNCTPDSKGLEVLRPMLANQGQQDGFGINGFAVGGRSLFARARAAQFIPPAEDVTRKTDDGTEATFVRYTIKQSFRAERAGEIKIPAATIRGLFATPNVEPIQGQELFAVSNIATLSVSNVPDVGRPKTFCGGIGLFDVASTITPEDAQVGDPMTLTMNVVGEGTLDLIVAPDLAEMDGIKGLFRVYEPTSRSSLDGRVFTFTLRPESADITELPAIPFSYFDVSQGQYTTVKTEPIALNISKATALEMNEVVGREGGNPANVAAAALQRNVDSLAANHVTMLAAPSRWLKWNQWFFLWALIIVATVCIRMLTTAGVNRNSDPVVLRRRLAVSNATAALQTSETAMAESTSVSADHFGRILIGLVADSTGQQTSGMTSTEAVATLAGLGIPSDIQQQASSFLQDCDAARFGASGDDQDRLLKQCQHLVKTLSKELRS